MSGRARMGGSAGPAAASARLFWDAAPRTALWVRGLGLLRKGRARAALLPRVGRA